MRKLVTIRVISDISPIENADNIEAVSIGGWKIVSAKGIHQVGNPVVFFEIDSFLPESDSRYQSFMKFGTRTFNGVVGHRVKTKRLRGVYSQGVILPISEFPELVNNQVGDDVTEILGIEKFELPVTHEADVAGAFPAFIPKTDQERIQNIYEDLRANFMEDKFVGTLKMDGSSVTVYRLEDGKYGICSRNLELKIDPETDLMSQGKFIQGAARSKLFDILQLMCNDLGGSWAIQGELVGPGVQGNYEKFNTLQVFAYNIFNITDGHYLSYREFEKICKRYNIQHVPEIYDSRAILQQSLEAILTMSEIGSINNPRGEGIVWKILDEFDGQGIIQFKSISNKYLEKEAD